jgi:AcrR family transcriptional regulator
MAAKKKYAPKRKKKVRANDLAPRQRLSPQIRKAQILDATARLIVEQGFLPLPIERLADAAGTSKALIYTYYSTQYALFNALLERELVGLATSGIETASQVGELEQAAVLCAMIYFEHASRAGPLLHILLADRYMRGHIERRLMRKRNAVLRRLAALGRRDLPLSKQEVLAAIEMVTAIPEEAGRLAFHQEIDFVVARQICRSLIVSSLQTLHDPDLIFSSVGVGPVNLHGADDVARTLQDHR